MQTNVVIRPAKRGDAKAVLKYLNQVGGETDNLLFGKEGVTFTEQQEEALIDEINSSPNGRMFIAHLDGQVIGIASIRGARPKRIAHQAEIGLSVLKDYWGMGIGRGLMDELITFARSVGTEIITLEVRTDNDRAITLYERYGFEKFGTYRRFFKIDGHYYDAYYMNLYLS